jgi:hypothetical protein
MADNMNYIMQNYLLENSSSSYTNLPNTDDFDSDKFHARNTKTQNQIYEPYGGFPPLVICSKIQNSANIERQITIKRSFPKRDLVKIDVIMKRRREQQQRLINSN